MSESRSLLATWGRLLRFQAVGILLSVLTMVLAAYAVPPEVWGEYGVFLSIVQVAHAVGVAWIVQALLRFGREEFGADGHITRTLSSSVGLAIPAVAALAGLLWLMGSHGLGWLPKGVDSFAMLAAGLAAMAAFELAAAAAQAIGRLDAYTVGQLFYRGGPFIVVAAASLGLRVPATGLMIGAIAAWIAAALVTCRACTGQRPRRSAFSGGPASRMIAFGRLLPLGSTAAILLVWLDVWLVRWVVGAEAAGVYWWAFSLLAMGAAVMIPLSASLAPGMIDLRLAGNQPEIERRRALIAAAALVALVLVVAAAPLLKAVAERILPARYAPAAPLLVILSLGLPAQLMSFAALPLVQAFESAVPRMVAVNVLLVLLKIVLGVPLILQAGVLGVATATAVVMWIGALALLALIPRSDGAAPDPLRALLAPAAAVGAGLVATFAVLWLPAVLGALVALGVALGLGLWLRSVGLLLPLRSAFAPGAAPSPRWHTRARALLRRIAGNP